MDDKGYSVIQVFLDSSTSRSDVVKINLKWECCVICHVRKMKMFLSSHWQVPAAGSGYHNFNENAMQFVFMTCGPWPRSVKWWGRHWSCIKEPFSNMAQNLLTCTLKLQRASKCKHSEIYECVRQCKTQSKLATSMAPLKTCFIFDKLGGNVAKSSTIPSDNR